ncbi:MAG: bifunctional phosphoribosylaminoimidazolecarboxamide formyltransferase/IMP cyclohydrolase [Flavobacteriales bacterium]|nr:bifunctional phosphoribosylaminoimidazolecarboxamide formyltransferase/IMP cyclohydrolase [Flavobacteriales bacterium]
MPTKRLQSALVSVFDKDGLEPIVNALHQLNITIYSTGGTQDFIEKLGVPVKAVEDLTGYPSILVGRVKTLHPKVFGGILARRNDEGDRNQLAEFAIPEIDLVVVDLYPFEKTVASGASHEDIVEKIDIGGISLIRAAAKNFRDVVIVSSKNQYNNLQEILHSGGTTSEEQRRNFAREAFDVSSHYDSKIYQWFCGDEIHSLKVSEQNGAMLRYGENPHQRGIFFGDLDAIFEKMNGKELSYNNLLDVDAAVLLMNEFAQKNDPTFAILKHNNACGIASRKTISAAYEAALACDPVSAFGGILITNVAIDAAAAEKINPLFCEVVIAPKFETQALEILAMKPNRILLRQKKTDLPNAQLRTLLNGVIWQERDAKSEREHDLKLVTEKEAATPEMSDLLFANKVVKHTKSNTIVLVKHHQLLASGTGQTSRVDALRQAIAKAHSFDFDLKGAVMASDAFFPFPDCVEIAHQAGITAVVQPGGSIKDQLSIDYCNANKMSMYMTGIRHFRH